MADRWLVHSVHPGFGPLSGCWWASMGHYIEAAVAVGRVHVRREAGQSAQQQPEAPDLSSSEPMKPRHNQAQPCELLFWWTRCGVLWQANLGAVSKGWWVGTPWGRGRTWQSRLWGIDLTRV